MEELIQMWLSILGSIIVITLSYIPQLSIGDQLWPGNPVHDHTNESICLTKTINNEVMQSNKCCCIVSFIAKSDLRQHVFLHTHHH